ncbi:hypothetical protein HPB49_016321 [Dermacentor silvarum]|uniref:Uncharacterized protein n=1 Tax=Dermacentor silvarum TaxID=543639 RepID=A0ACB8DE99_DERSI|nr:hypothetical protein HPB49_016321 [Dermacentor silvarum]
MKVLKGTGLRNRTSAGIACCDVDLGVVRQYAAALFIGECSVTPATTGKTTEFSRDFKVSPTPKSSRSSRSGDSNGRVSSMDDIGKLYELSDDPKRKEFLDDLFSFMQKRAAVVARASELLASGQEVATWKAKKLRAGFARGDVKMRRVSEAARTLAAEK